MIVVTASFFSASPRTAGTGGGFFAPAETGTTRLVGWLVRARRARQWATCRRCFSLSLFLPRRQFRGDRREFGGRTNGRTERLRRKGRDGRQAGAPRPGRLRCYDRPIRPFVIQDCAI
uniref:Secreted protein n=1 Tax=Plectus sambesii TaxID=2011161 RepID=A0A914WQ42_9BILA